MRLKAQLSIAFDNINSIQKQINSLIIPPDFRSDINHLYDQTTLLSHTLLTLEEVHSAGDGPIWNEIYSIQDPINRITIPDYSSDFLVLQGETTSINAKIDGIDITS